MNYSVKFLPLKNAMLKYWCVLANDVILFYYLCRVDALEKLKELENTPG